MSNRILIVTNDSEYSDVYDSLIFHVKHILKTEGTEKLEAFLQPKGYYFSSRQGYDEEWFSLFIWSKGESRPRLELEVKDLSPVFFFFFFFFSRKLLEIRNELVTILAAYMLFKDRYSALDFTLYKNRNQGILLSSGGYNNHIESNAIRIETLAKIADHIKSLQNAG